MKNLLTLAVSLMAVTASAAGNEDFVKSAAAAMGNPVAVESLKGVPVAPPASAAAPLSESQYNTLIALANKIRQCPVYSVNYGRNKPYEDGCVELMVGAAVRVYESFLPDSAAVVRDMKQILRCPTYSVNYGRNKPYEENCVDGLVEVVTGHLKDRAKAAAAPASEARKFFSRW